MKFFINLNMARFIKNFIVVNNTTLVVNNTTMKFFIKLKRDR